MPTAGKPLYRTAWVSQLLLINAVSSQQLSTWRERDKTWSISLVYAKDTELNVVLCVITHWIIPSYIAWIRWRCTTVDINEQARVYSCSSVFGKSRLSENDWWKHGQSNCRRWPPRMAHHLRIVHDPFHHGRLGRRGWVWVSVCGCIMNREMTPASTVTPRHPRQIRLLSPSHRRRMKVWSFICFIDRTWSLMRFENSPWRSRTCAHNFDRLAIDVRRLSLPTRLNFDLPTQVCQWTICSFNWRD